MPFASYTELKAEIAAWLSRDDVSTSVGGVDTYIDLAEAWFNRNLRTRQMTTSVGSLTVSSGTITHPTAWLEWKSVVVMTTPMIPLEVTSEESALALDQANEVGTPERVIVRGDNSIVWPSPDGTYTYRGVFYRTVPALNITDNGSLQSSNWILASYPDAYLYGALLQSHARLVGDERVPLWQAAFDRVVAEIERADERAVFGGSTPTPQPWGVV